MTSSVNVVSFESFSAAIAAGIEVTCDQAGVIEPDAPLILDSLAIVVIGLSLDEIGIDPVLLTRLDWSGSPTLRALHSRYVEMAVDDAFS